MQTLCRVRNLRKNLTNAERKLWRVLRKKQLSSLRFRRQVPIGPFIVDFICFEKRLVIEVDGGQHDENKEYDEKRTIWLEDQGFRVIRFWNNEVMNNINGVATFILTMCSEFPPS
jgi:very-short-patch-repair endonuclease